MRTRDWVLKASPVTPPPWRQRIRGRWRVGSGVVEVIVMFGMGVVVRVV